MTDPPSNEHARSGKQLRQADQADVERRMGEAVHLVRDGDGRELGPEDRDQLAADQQRGNPGTGAAATGPSGAAAVPRANPTGPAATPPPTVGPAPSRASGGEVLADPLVTAGICLPLWAEESLLGYRQDHLRGFRGGRAPKSPQIVIRADPDPSRPPLASQQPPNERKRGRGAYPLRRTQAMGKDPASRRPGVTAGNFPSVMGERSAFGLSPSPSEATSGVARPQVDPDADRSRPGRLACSQDTQDTQDRDHRRPRPPAPRRTTARAAPPDRWGCPARPPAPRRTTSTPGLHVRLSGGRVLIWI